MVMILSPLVDRDGAVIESANGVPLAADEVGLVYTLSHDGEPEAMGELTQDEAGRVILVALPPPEPSAMGALDPRAKGERLMALGRRRAQMRGRITNGEGALARLRAEGVPESHPTVIEATRKLERWKTKLQAIQAKLEAVNNETLGDGDDPGMDLEGLGSFRTWWSKNKNVVGGVAAGAAGAALVGTAATDGTGANRFVKAAASGVRDFFTKRGGTPAPASAAAPSAFAPVGLPAAAQPPMEAGTPAPASTTATWLLVGGLGLGALLLLRRK